MSGVPNGKLRILYILRMLEEETDEERGLSMAGIVERLGDYGMSADRKTVYADFKLLREFGLKIGTAQRNPVEYYVQNHDFTIDELMLMVDAVQSCRLLTQTQADKISRNVKLLATEGQQEKIERRIHVDGRARGRNDAALANVDAIHEAMRKKSRITYTYWKMGTDGKQHAQHEGALYDVTPMRVTFSDNYYYLTAFSERDQEVREYRVDRMRDVRVTGERARRGAEIPDYDYQPRDSQFFGRFDGPVAKATLTCDEDGVGIVHDRFGRDARWSPARQGAEPGTDAARARAHVSVRVSPQFFGWVASMAGHVKIAAPKKLGGEYEEYLRGLLGE